MPVCFDGTRGLKTHTASADALSRQLQAAVLCIHVIHRVTGPARANVGVVEQIQTKVC